MPKYEDYPAKTAPSNSDIVLVADSAASNATKRMTRGQFLSGTPLPANTVDTQAIEDDAVTAPKISGFDKSNLTVDSNPYKFYAYRNTNFTGGTPSKVVLNAEVFDTNNDFNTTDGKYVVPVSGFYQLNGAVGFAGQEGGGHYVAIYKNGSLITRGDADIYYAGPFDGCDGISALLQLTAGDEIELYWYGSGMTAYGDSRLTYFMGHLVSRT